MSIKNDAKTNRIRRLNNSNLVEPKDFDPHFKHMSNKKFIAKMKTIVSENVLRHCRYLFINKTGNTVLTCCSHCGHKGTLKKVIKNRQKVECEACKSNLEVRNTKFASYKDSTFREFIMFDVSTISNEIIIAYQFAVVRTIKGVFGEIKVEDDIVEAARYYFDMKSKNRLMQYGYWSEKWFFNNSIFEVNSSQYYFMGYGNGTFLDAMAKCVEFEHFPAELNRSETLIKGLDFYTTHPNIELITKLGLYELVTEKLSGGKTHGLINWKGKTVQKILKLNRAEIKFFIEQTDRTYKALYIMQIIIKSGLSLEKEFKDATRIVTNNHRSTLTLKELLSIDLPSRMLRYLTTQTDNNSKKYRHLATAVGDFADMIADMKKLNMKINKRTIYPKDLDKRHQDIADMIVIESNRDKEERIAARLEKLMGYEYASDGFVIFPARSVSDLIAESKELGHCVKNYAERYADGKTNIFLLRRQEEKEKPLYTVEVNADLKVVQCRGKHNDPIKDEDSGAKVTLEAFKKKLMKKNRSVTHEQIAN